MWYTEQEFWRLVCQYGPPKFVISDNGGEFTGAIFTKLLEQLRVEHRLIASYHPNANGRVERAIKDIKLIIIKLSQSNPQNWPTLLPFATYCYNTRISSRTKSSPFALYLGRDPHGFNDYRQLDPTQPSQPNQIQNEQDYLPSD